MVTSKKRLKKLYWPDQSLQALIFFNGKYPYYRADFDSSGKKLREYGYCFSISDDCFDQDIDSLRTGTDINAEIPVANAPGYTIQMIAGLFDSTGQSIEFKDSLPIKGNSAFLKFMPVSPSSFRLGLIGIFRNSRGEFIRIDTMTINCRSIK